MSLNNLNWSDKSLPTKSSFFHYTRIDSANKILESEYMYASLISDTNDNNEKERYKNTEERTFIICFCNSKSEKIPMWYLYSGIAGKGIRLGLSPSKMRKLVNSITVIHPVFDFKVNEKVELHIHEDFEIDTGWVFYSQYPLDKRVKFKSTIYTIEDSFEDFQKNNDFIKNYEWNYEKEFRIVIKLKNNKINCEKVAIKIYPYDFTLRLAPENKDKESLIKLEGFKKFLKKYLEDSDLQISMNLIYRDFNSIIDYIHSLNDINKREKIRKALENEREEGN